MRNNNLLLGHLACFTAYVIFGLNIIVCKDLTRSDIISPMALFCLRSLGAGFLFGFLSFFSPPEKIERGDYIKIFMASLLGFFVTQITFLIAISSITPVDCSVISAMSPICTMLVAAVIIGEPITPMKVGGVMLSFVGILYLILSSFETSTEVVTTTSGVVLMLINCLCFSAYLGIFKPLILKYSVVTFMKWIFLFASGLSLPFAFKDLLLIDYSLLSVTMVWEIVFLIVCATCITYFLIPFGQKHVRPTLVSLYSYVQPIVAIVVSIYMGMDVLSFSKITAILVIVFGVLLVNLSKKATV